MDIDQKNLENDRQLNMIGLSDYGKTIAQLLVWLPALPKQSLDELLNRVRMDVRSNEPTEVLSGYYEEDERVEKDITEASFLRHLIHQHAPFEFQKLQQKIIELENENSALSALIDQLQDENKQLLKLQMKVVDDNQQLTYVADDQKERLKTLEHNDKFLRKQVRDLSIQVVTCIQILKICSDTDRHLTHAQRQAFAEVGLKTLKALFPKGITPENFPTHEEKIQVNEDYDPIPFDSSSTKGGEF